MTSIFLLLVMRDARGEAAFARFKTAMKAMPSYEVHFSGGQKGHHRVTADLIFDGTKRFYYDAETARGHYRATICPTGFRELDFASRTYDEFQFPGHVTAYASRITSTPGTIPFWLLQGDLYRMLPPGTKPVYVGQESVNGISCDSLTASFENPQGRGKFEFCVARSGLVYRLYRSVDSAEGHSEFEWTFKDYKPFQTMSQSRFENQVPDAFSPFSLPDRDIPVPVGKKPDLRGWMDPNTGRAWTAPSGRPLLFVLSGRDSLPSAKAVKAIEQWRSALRTQGITVAVGIDSPSAAGSKGLLYDPDQRSLNDLEAPATPMFYLVDKHGVVQNLWMGFDAGKAEKFRSDLFKAAAALK